MMRVRPDIDQKVLSELFYQYLNVEEYFVKDLFTLGDTQLGRVFVREPVLPTVLSNDNAIHALDYERASQVIKTASHMGISTCYCRHKMYHMGKACERPMDICMTFNTSARSLIKYNHAGAAGVEEGLDLLAQTCESDLVSANDFKKLKKKKTRLNQDICLGCGLCIRVCEEDSLKFEPLFKRVITSLNGAHRTVIMVIERGKLQPCFYYQD